MFKRLKPVVIFEIFIHILFWAFITLFPILFGPFSNMPHQLWEPWHFALINIFFAIQFYLHAFFLIPRILTKKNIGLYFGLLLVTFIGFHYILTYLIPPMPLPQMPLRGGNMPRPPPFVRSFNFFPLAAITAAAFAYRYLADRSKEINIKKDITNAGLKSELAFLRSQISPHFLFNIINSIVSLSRLNPAAVEPTLIQLSKLMRYMLYIPDIKRVTLSDKEAYLVCYIELQRLRVPDIVRIKFNSEIADNKKSLEPMLLIPFVENAFKHCTSDLANAAIDINLRSDDKTLFFSVQNTYNPNEHNDHEEGGIGLKNVKRRLELLYPNKHALVIVQTENFYTVNLQIQLK
jgi:two-component system LytT family sensor kinase